MRFIDFKGVGRTSSEFSLRTTLRHLRGKAVIASLASVLAAFAQTVNPNTVQGPGPGPIGPGPGCNLLPASPSVGATVDLSYFGPPPSTSNPSLVGPLQLLRSGVVDAPTQLIPRPESP